jgi:L-iditol 2-dehydrogenase
MCEEAAPVMKVVKVYSFTDVRVEDAPVPAIGPDEILVRARACGICSGDVMPWYIERKAPLVLGHEPAGVVAKVGENVKNFKVGDRVFVHHHAPCNQCRECQRGNYSMCDTWKKSMIDPGGMAEYFRVPAINLTDTLVLPDHVSFEDGVLVEPAACAVKALRKARIHPGDTVLVVGLGVMGQMLAILARQYGAARVFTTDFVASRREMSRKNGADASFDPAAGDVAAQLKAANDGRLADVVIVGPPSVPAMQSGLDCCGKGATLVLFSPSAPEATWTINPHDIYFKEITIVPSYSCGPTDTREALAHIAAGHLTADMVVTHRYDLNDAAAGYRAMAGAGDVIKVVVHLPEQEV